MNRPFLATLVLALAAAAPASADSKVKLFPLSGPDLPKSLRGAPDELSRVLARSLEAELATVTIDDAVGLIGCTITERSCLQEIARTTGAGTIVFGKIEMDGDAGKIVLTLFDGTDERHRTLKIKGDDVDTLVTSLKETLDPKPTNKTPEPPTVPIDTTPIETTTGGGVTSGTWSMIIGGGVAVGAGLAFVVSAQGLKRQLDKAPTETREDIDHLIALERAGKTRMQIGGVLMGVGGVVATIGVVRAIVQKNSRTERTVIDVVPEQGGASVFLTVHR